MVDQMDNSTALPKGLWWGCQMALQKVCTRAGRLVGQLEDLMVLLTAYLRGHPLADQLDNVKVLQMDMLKGGN